MAFVKLDCGILNSTLWVEREPRDVFITALLMAQPIELRESMPQYSVRSLEQTGFTVPPGWYGFVQAAGPGIVRMAMAEQSAGMDALEKLGAPDPESRSSDFEGRRLVRVDGGYVILNFMKYRDKDNTSAVRSARYRERKAQRVAAAPDEPSRRGDAYVTRDASRSVTKAEAEAEAEIQRVPSGLVVKDDVKRQPNCPFESILALYHQHCPSLPRVMVQTNMRLKHTGARWKQILAEEKEWTAAQALDWFGSFFRTVEKSDFLTGRASENKRAWRADFQWLMTAGNFAKVVEGKYQGDRA